MSPILVRPVREQLEHDRVIRLLQTRLKRRGEVVANIGEDQTVPVKIGQMVIFPDLVLTSADRGKKLVGTVEVETSESVNHLEARAQWAHLGRAKAPFHLYVPVGSVEIARRLAHENGVNVSEIWSYHTLGDQTRFTLVHRSSPEPRPARAAPKRPSAAGKTAAPKKRESAAEGTRGTPRRGASAPPARAAARRKAVRAAAPKASQKRK